ncbi:hypothetical protein [Prosthecobacter sp.]|uniref:hypothetical protein n=1 Tax=Prosthecobacter sp. TaxID=1965333 RepID=UPI001DF7DC17|nr:hypothetical protein [Prosthecobacter sp.]MCB1279388.1 hypothetical protein [Prosthecobacter sp.]
MTPRQKCAHCGKIADFRDDFCTLCWSHRIKGKVLTDEQIASCQSQFAAANEQKRWQAEFGTWQTRLLMPAILMTLWCVYWAFVTLPFYLKFDLGLLELLASVFCIVSFAGGGFLVGGSKMLKSACVLLILGSVVSAIHIGDYFLDVANGASEAGKGMLWSSVRLVLCGTILVSAVQILRINRPAA